MKRTSLYTGRFALTGVAAAALWLTVPDVWALGLGRLAVQSSLGETLRAEIDVTSITPEEAANLRVRVAPPESYRTAGVDYNAVLPGTTATLLRRPDGRPYLQLISDRAVQEPFVDVILEISWTSGRLVREYTLLFDPPARAQAAAPAPAPSTAPVLTPRPAPAPPVAVAPVPAPAPAAPAPAPSPRPPSARVAAPELAQPEPSGVDEYRVRRGDTLYSIAGRTQRPGASLEQMLVALFRDNPDAFIADNMNRLKAGAVLAVPSAETAGAVSSSEAREVIQAQSADFGAYRARLAGGVPAAKTEGSERQAGGKVQATVEDRKEAAAPTPDKLTLSKGGVSPKTPTPEEALAKEREKQDAATRVAELSKNVEELKRLARAASVPAVKAPAAAPASAPDAAKPAVGITAPVLPPAPPPPAVAAQPAPAASPILAAPAASPVIAKPPARPVARPTPPAPAPLEEPGVLGTMFDDNPWALGLGGALVALLAGFGIYRFSRRSKKDSGETSFLESRLQPDSFFGASGGQRIDTRDAGGASSSMSYSLSQLDAIGDVDPVAEADVYLAYGRDLQAEEILKEAMRSNPERMAIRTKLLEVYAKRRDTKGFELLATQLFALTRGEGEDWARAQEMGQQIDPENTLYQPGGEPALPPVAEGARVSEPLGASTMPQSVLPSPSQFEAAHAELEAKQSEAVDSGSVDLDLDLDLAAPAGTLSASSPMVSTQPLPRQPEPESHPPSDNSFSFDSMADFPSVAPAPAPAPAASTEFPMDFDLSAISLDLESPGSVSAPAVAPLEENGADLSGIDFAAEDDAGDPLARKLELAEEFRQIGDMEGARDLLQEVVAKAGGALKTKAQGMLNELR